MTTHTIRDPFTGKDVKISDRLTDRLRGRYAIGPLQPNGEPEFGWRQYETPPVQHQAADRITTLEVVLNYVADMTYCGTDAEWHFKPGYDPQKILDALAPEQGK